MKQAIKPKEFRLDKIATKYKKLMKGIDIPSNPSSLPYAHTIGSAPINPVNMTDVKRRAASIMTTYSVQRLTDLYSLVEQNKKLEEIAWGTNDPKLVKTVLEQKSELENQVQSHFDSIIFSTLLLDSRFGFIPGENLMYHLYLTDKNEKVLSIIGPDENPPYETFICSAKYLADKTFQLTKQSPELRNILE